MTNDQLLQLVVTHAVQISVVTLLAFTLTSLFRRHARLCWAIWFVVLVKCVTPPVIGHQVSVFHLTNEIWNSVAEQWPKDHSASPTASLTPMDAKLFETSGPGQPDAPEASDELNSVSAHVTVRRLGELIAVDGAAATGRTWSHWLLMGIASLSFCSSLLLFVRYVRCRRQISQARTSNFDDRVQRLLADISTELALRKLPRIMVTGAKFGPAVIGIFRPLIVLPQILVQQLDDETLKPVIAHELIHIRRGDLLVGVLQAVAHCLWWFHPFVWLANRTISRFAEQCCDEQVLSETGCSARQYAQSLLAVIECRSRLVPVPVFPGMKPVEITQQRLEKIMTLKQGRSRRNRVASAAAILTLSILVLPGAMTATSQEETRDSTALTPPQLPVGSPLPVPRMEYRRYDVADVVSRMCEELQITQLDATLNIQQKLRFAARNRQPQQAAAQAMVPFGIEPHAKETYEWNLGTTQAGHDAVAQTLSLLRIYGFARIKIKATIFSAAPVVIAESLRNNGIKVKPVATTLQRSGIEFGLLRLSSPLPNAGLRIEPAKVAPVAFSETRIRRAVSIATAIVAEQDAARLIASANSNNSMLLLSSPEVITFNGHDASISSGESRPFVTGYHQNQAQIQIATTGLGVSVTPRLAPDGIELNCGVSISTISDLKTQTVLGTGNSSKQTIEIPEVTEQTVRAAVALKSGETFVVTGLTRETEAGRLEEVLVLLAAEELKPDPPVAAVDDPDESGATVRLYRVADLITPITNYRSGSDIASLPNPPMAALQSETPQSKPKGQPQFPRKLDGEAAKLVELIHTAVSPESWDVSGGDGAVAFHRNTISLVIRQQSDVHKQIVALLHSLRRHQDQQVSTEVWAIATTPDLPSAWSTRLRFTEVRPGFSWAMATSGQMEAIDATLQKNNQHFTASDRVKVTAFDQQSIELPVKFADTSILELNYVPSILPGNELLKLNLKLTPSSLIIADTDSRSLSAILSSGTTLVLNYRPTLTAGVPLLEKIPSVNALFTNLSRSADGEDIYVFLTPENLDVSAFEEDKQ